MAIVEFGMNGVGHTSRVENLTISSAIALASELVFTFSQQEIDESRRYAMPSAVRWFISKHRPSYTRESWENSRHWVTIVR